MFAQDYGYGLGYLSMITVCGDNLSTCIVCNALQIVVKLSLGNIVSGRYGYLTEMHMAAASLKFY